MDDVETVLILQGGGSLGAYECGVYKTLEKKNIKFDVISGSSIGAINALIIAGSGNPSKTLEDFWMGISQKFTPEFYSDEIKKIHSSFNSAIYGVPKIFRPESNIYSWFFHAANFPHMYDIEPFRETIKEFVDFEKINKKSKTRVILTSVNIQKSESCTFDSQKQELDIDHALACISYPFYGVSWTKKNGQYFWDGSLLSNTPLREVINASPQMDKKVYLVSLFPRKHTHLPKNMFEVWHRARDIMHTDKTKHNVKMSRVISRQLDLLKKMYSILKETKLDENSQKKFRSIENEYNKLVKQRGSIIENIIKIERKEQSHFLFEDADFSDHTIRDLIKQGQEDAAIAITQSEKKLSPHQ